MTSTPTGRSRRLSTGSNSEAALFPIYEDPDQDTLPLFSDLESVAGSEIGWADDSSTAGQQGAVSKEQLVVMLGKMRARYHKYKGRYTDLAGAYKKMEGENKKVKEVMQQTQDKALRRISELKEQAALEKQAKAHLEEELRAEIEEKQHYITSLNTKVMLLKKDQQSASDDKFFKSPLIDLSADSGNHEELDNGGTETGKDLQSPDNDSLSAKSEDSDKILNLEEKVKKLENLLSKCKENIKANKNKLTALTEVKDQLATDLELKETELGEEKDSHKKVLDELQIYRKREEGEELQMAEAKLAMHHEMITKDEEISALRASLAKENEEKDKLREEKAEKVCEIGNLHLVCI